VRAELPEAKGGSGMTSELIKAAVGGVLLAIGLWGWLILIVAFVGGPA
jgi:hypothetical protein